MNKCSLTVLVLIFSWLSLASSNTHAEDNYEIVDLGELEEGSDGVYAFDIDDAQNVVGYSVIDDITGYWRGFLYNSSNTNLTDLGAITGQEEILVEITNTVDGEEVTESVDVGIDDTSSVIFSLNNNGIAAGFSYKVNGFVVSTDNEDGTTTEAADRTIVERAVYIDTNTLELTELPDFIDGEQRNMRAVAVSGDYVVGGGVIDEPDDVLEDGSENTNLYNRGFIYDIGSSILTKIEPPFGTLTNNISIKDINESGFAIGSFVDEDFISRVVGVSILEPENLFEYSLFDTTSIAGSINSNNKIVGLARHTSGGYNTAYLHDINTGVTTDLGVLNSNFPSSEAFDINDSDQIVGISQTKNKPASYSGFIYENGEMKDLSKMIGCDTGWTIHEARSINNDGYIVGTGLLNGEARGFMLRPLTGTAPICELDDDSGSGSSNLFLLCFLLIFAAVRLAVVRAASVKSRITL